MGVSNRELTVGDWAVLALLCEQPSHGWAIAGKLSREGELGTVWSLGRPLVYRALETLEDQVLIEPAGLERGTRGPQRTIFVPTVAGQQAVHEWLRDPVPHVRDMRSLLLLKLVFAARAHVDSRELLEGQRDILQGTVEALSARTAGSVGADAILLRFRAESSQALLRFVEGLLDSAETSSH